MAVTMPAWTFSEVWTQMLALLNNPLIMGLVEVTIAISIAGMLINFAKDAFGKR
jgi:hypothetical protein